MAVTHHTDATHTGYISAEESRAIFDHQARTLMGMSAEEFLRRWDIGEFQDVFDTPGHEDLTSLVMLMPLARQNG
jgi:hypothetical protein